MDPLAQGQTKLMDLVNVWLDLTDIIAKLTHVQWLTNLLSCSVSDWCNTWQTDSDLRMYWLTHYLSSSCVSDWSNSGLTDSDLHVLIDSLPQ